MTCPWLSTELEVPDPGLQPLIVQSQVICLGVAPATPRGVTVGASSEGPSIFSALQPSQVILDLQSLLGVPGFPHVTKIPQPRTTPREPPVLAQDPFDSLWSTKGEHPSQQEFVGG